MEEPKEMTLAELRAEKRRIDQAIRNAMMADYKQYGLAKIDKEHFPTSKPDEFMISVFRQTPCDGRREGWTSIIRNNDKAEAIKCIPKVIEDLQRLYDELMEGGE